MLSLSNFFNNKGDNDLSKDQKDNIFYLQVILSKLDRKNDTEYLNSLYNDTVSLSGRDYLLSKGVAKYVNQKISDGCLLLEPEKCRKIFEKLHNQVFPIRKRCANSRVSEAPKYIADIDNQSQLMANSDNQSQFMALDH
ncbi:hypothetical protein L3V79_05245 [Thiotrichales bacterium 19S9-12]|nr:hypothetical protein [Thiotrichales bacterium 19S9-11]MCF6811764.1 hypothetical protein [Thiotrichales bacterium 19S9-12]